MAQSIPPHARAGIENPAEITTLVHDPLHDEVLLRLPGAVVLPPGTVIELAGGEIARVTSLRLVVADASQAQLHVQVVRSRPMAQGDV